MAKKPNPKPAKASSSSKKKNGGKKHVCGEINGVMGKGSFSKENGQFRCVECGKLWPNLPADYLRAVKNLDPKRAALLEKGAKHKTIGAEHEKWSKAGKKAWATRQANLKAKKNGVKK